MEVIIIGNIVIVSHVTAFTGAHHLYENKFGLHCAKSQHVQQLVGHCNGEEKIKKFVRKRKRSGRRDKKKLYLRQFRHSRHPEWSG